MRISYSDGDVVEEHIADVLGKAKDVSSTSAPGYAEYGEWPVRYHLCPERGNLLRHLDFTGLDVVELGAGMGGASRYVAENAKSFLAVEGSPRRLGNLKKRLRDLDNWDSVVENIGAFETDRRFDVVCLIGVLEYSELYIDTEEGESPFAKVLAKARSFLKPGGVVIVAIENRNGIKYWAGAPEDHTGQMFDGICGYSAAKTPRTFSRNRLLKIFEETNLGAVEEFYPWPDYKTPHAIVSKRMVDQYPDLAADMAVDAVMREPIEGVRYFPTTLAIYETVPSGLYGDMANSFLFVGGSEESSATRDRLFRRMNEDKEVGWHYSLGRDRPVRTVLRAGDEPTFHKMPLKATDEVYRSPRLTWRDEPPVAAARGLKVDRILRKAAYFEGRQEFERQFLAYLGWALDKWSVDDTHMDPLALDAVLTNAFVTPDGYRNFDLEWVVNEPMAKSWFVFRNVCVSVNMLWLFKKAEYVNAEELYEVLCAKLGVVPDLNAAMRKEAAIQADINSHRTADEVYTSLDSWMRASHGSYFPRDSKSEQILRRDLIDNPETSSILRALQADNQRMHEQLDKRCVRMGLALDTRLRRLKPLFHLMRKSGASMRLKRP